MSAGVMSARGSRGPEAVNGHDTRSKSFRFKDEGDRVNSPHEESASSRKRRRHHHSSRHRSKRSRTSHLGDDPAQIGESMRNLRPDRAFQESLFDALGDDEGAAFWEGVYGQPIHNYPNTYIDEDTGEVEQMNDEEYAQYVRRKMWEKSREGIEAAQEEKSRERARERTKAREREEKPRPSDGPHNNFVFDFEIDASLRRGQRRKDQKRWQELWKGYLQRWDQLQILAKDSSHTSDTENLFLRNKIAWPVESGQRKDVNSEEIDRFISKGTEGLREDGRSSRDSLLSALKVERVRWHPDKIQQRYGFMQIDEATVKGVTAVFQVFDHMWNERRGIQKD